MPDYCVVIFNFIYVTLTINIFKFSIVSYEQLNPMISESLLRAEFVSSTKPELCNA